MKKIVLLDIDRPKKGKYQFFLDWFKEAWIANGGEVKTKIELPRLLRSVISRTRITRSTFLRNKEVAVLAIGGADIDFTAFPYPFFYEVVPVYWDTWPCFNNRLISGLKRNNIQRAFFTQRQVAKFAKDKFPNIDTFWLPEGIKADIYRKGGLLTDRGIDILQYGRRLEAYHEVILRTIQGHKYLFSENLMQRIFKNQDELVQGLSNSKICICFPRSDTHPEMAAGIETLTQRYWEAMLSGCLLVGRAPKELIDLLGYNPVIEIDWDEPEVQLSKLLNSIGEYQEFVDKNHKKAVEICSWTDRVTDLISKLDDLGYRI